MTALLDGRLAGAVCAGMPVETFITAGPRACQAAARVCNAGDNGEECPVRGECLQRALAHPPQELYGVFGGYALHNSKGRHSARLWLESHGFAVPDSVVTRTRAHRAERKASLRQSTEPAEPEDFRDAWPERSPLD